MFQWTKSCAYDDEQKRRFHSTARSRLKKLAAELGLPPGSFDLRSNKGGIAVSGEITLHHNQLYVQVGQFGLSSGHGILIRTCKGRRDFTGGPNHFASLALLDDIPALAAMIHRYHRCRRRSRAGCVARGLIAHRYPASPALAPGFSIDRLLRIPVMPTYRLGSNELVHAPGVIAWAINGYAFERDRAVLRRVIVEGWPGVTSDHAHQLLSKVVPYSIESDAVVFTVSDSDEVDADNQ